MPDTATVGVPITDEPSSDNYSEGYKAFLASGGDSAEQPATTPQVPQNEPGRIVTLPQGPLEWGKAMLGGVLHPIRSTETAIEQAAIAAGLANPGDRLLWSPARQMETPMFGTIPQIPKIGPEGDTLGKLSAGLVNTVTDFVNFMQTPEGVMSLGIGALKKEFQKLVLGKFGVEMAQAAPEQLITSVEAAKQGDYQTAAHAGLSGVGSGVMLGLLAQHGGAPEPTSPLVTLPKSVEAIANEASRVRRISQEESTARVKQAIARREANNANIQDQVPPASSVPAVVGEPVIASPEIKVESGTPLRSGESGGGQAGAVEVKTPEVASPVPTPVLAENPPAAKVAIFGGYQFDNPNLPSFKIPGVRPGVMRHVSAATAKQLGYELPPEIPTFEDWKAAQAPAAAAAPAIAPSKPGVIPIKIEQADGTVVPGEFTGYYDMRSIGKEAIPSVGKALPDGKMTHGMLGPGEKIIGDIPTVDEWLANKEAKPVPKVDPVEKFLDGLRITPEGPRTYLPLDLGLTKEVWNGLIETVRLAYRGGKGIKEAVESGLAWLKQNQPRAALDFEGLRAFLEKTIPPSPVTAPTLPAAQVSGGAAEVGRIADEIYKQRESAGAQLEGLAYERKQFKTARAEMKRLNDLATARFIQEGVNPEETPFPNPTDGVAIEEGQIFADDTFVNALAKAGIQHDPAIVRDLQEELFLESAAHRYNNLQARIQRLRQVETFYEQLGVDPAETKKLTDQIARLEAKASDLGDAELRGTSVASRASEITATEGVRQERMAQRAALSLEPVSEFFGRETGRYRDFDAKAKAGLEFAQLLRGAVTDPEALKVANANVEAWINLPDDIRQAIRIGKPLTDEQRASIFAALAEIYDDFDISRTRMREIVDAKIPEINLQIRKLLGEIADSKVKAGMGEVLLSDVLSTLDGETGMTGTLQSNANAQALRQRISAIESFAMAIGNDLETNKALFEWLTDPTTTFTPSPGGAYGVDAGTLQMILSEIKRNPNFGSAVLTLIESANKKLANLPVVGLSEIEKLVKEGTPEAQAKAESIADKLKEQARARTSLAAAQLRRSLKELDALEIERKSLQDGNAMFDQLAGNPDFKKTRDAVSNSPYGLVEPMVLQNNRETTFQGFGGTGLPTEAGFTMGAGDNPVMKAGSFVRTAAWNAKAQEYLDAYDAANALHTADPINNPQPTMLGFDLPKVRGLRDATRRFVAGSFLDLSLNAEGGRWRVPGVARFLSQAIMFRQHDMVSKMVGGTSGFDLRGRLADYINHFLIGQGIKDKYSDIPLKLHAALRSHPEANMNMANYRETWNEIAHWGRLFGSPVRAGFVLPRSGRVVTAQDMALLQRQRAFEDELRRRVTETNPTQGIRLKRPTRTLVRPGAYVGDEGLPRYPSRQADPFISDVRAAYELLPPPGSPVGTKPGVRTIDATTDLGPTSADPVVAFWNKRLDMLVDHVLDSRRDDRSMRLTPGMRTAENEAAIDWSLNGKPPIQSVGDLVDALVAHHPQTAGLNVRDQVIAGLNAELRQYRDVAQRMATERAEQDQARHTQVSVDLTADNEFTRPAAKLELPSSLYDYGAITPAEHMLVTARANHERILGYSTALNRAITEIQDRLTRFRSGEITEDQAAGSYGGNINEMKQVLGLLSKVAADFKAAQSNGNPTSGQAAWFREGFGLLTSAVLALPTVSIRNMTQGQFEVYAMSKAMGNMGHRLTMWHALNNMQKTLVRQAMDIGYGAVKNTNLGLALLTGKNFHLFENAVAKIADVLTWSDFRASGDRIGELGMDNRTKFLERMRRIWQETAEFTSPEEEQKAWLVPFTERKLGATAALPIKTLRAIFDFAGVHNSDFAINATTLNHTVWLEKRLEEAALNYGAERERQNLGAFDPTKSEWQLKPDEWSSFLIPQERADALANTRLFFEGSANPEGFQLERALWEFYQKKKAGQKPNIFTDRQLDAVQRKWLADVNASTPANRASGAAGNPVVRTLLTLQGYVSDGLLKIINAPFGGERDRSALASAIGKIPPLMALAAASVAIGYFTGGVTGQWEKRVRGRYPSMPSPLDRDFWTSWKRFGEGTWRLGMAQPMLIGDLLLQLVGSATGRGYGFDPAGRIFALSQFSGLLTAIAGAYATRKAGGTIGDTLVPLADIGRRTLPYMLEAENLFSNATGWIKQDERIRRGEAQTQGLLEGKTGFQPPSYGPTTVFRRNLSDAISRWFDRSSAGDTNGAAKYLATAQGEVKKLEDYHFQKYIAAGMDEFTARDKAQKDVWNDYQDINPAVTGMLGRRPTQAQNELVLSGITGDRRAVVDKGDNAWKAGAMALFNREGYTTKEEAADARASGGKALPGLRPPTPRMPRASVGRAQTAGLRRTPGQSPLRGSAGSVRRPSVTSGGGTRVRRAGWNTGRTVRSLSRGAPQPHPARLVRQPSSRSVLRNRVATRRRRPALI